MEPGHANPAGNVDGGVIMRLVDSAGAIAASRHCRSRVVTAALDSMSFLAPAYVGDVVSVHASVNDAGHTSMEVGVRVEVEDLRTGQLRHVSSAHLVFVALDEQGRPTRVPPAVAETEDERRRQDRAKIRRQQRALLRSVLAANEDAAT
ncbi:MAG: acyl-CoA thioesterase [Candidatus Dormibacteria bacterium]